MNANAAIGDELLKFELMEAGDFASSAEGDLFLLKESDRDFSEPVGFVEGVGLVEVVGEAEDELHGYVGVSDFC